MHEKCYTVACIFGFVLYSHFIVVVAVSAVAAILLFHPLTWMVHKSHVVYVLLCSVGANPFDEDEEDEDFSNVVGVPVEALYDYNGQENDELSFKKGIAFDSEIL